jgi:PAS domain S-box-containing protein
VTASTDLTGAVTGRYGPLLVAISVGVSVIAGFAAILIADRLRAVTSRRAAWGWLATGALVLGSGIWCMHFVGMLAFELPIPVRYDVATTLLSVLPSILASGIALVAIRRSRSFWGTSLAGLLTAVGIGSMHYSGMAAMSMRARMVYHPGLFVASLLVAHGLATLALVATDWMRRRWADAQLRRRLVSGAVLGCAVSGMQYTAMAASVYLPRSDLCVATAGLAQEGLALWVVPVTLLVIGASAIAALVDERLDRVYEALRIAEEGSRRILETAGEAIVVIDGRGVVRGFNRAAESTFGYASEEIVGRNVSCLMPPEVAAQHDHYIRRYLEARQSRIIGVRREVTGLRKDGTRFPLSLVVSELSVSGFPVFTGVLMDLSERRELEAKLLQARKLEAIGQLAAGVAHEINTPAQYVSDNLEFLSEAFTSLESVLKGYEALAASAAEGPVDPAQLAELQALRDAAELAYLREEIPRALAGGRDGVSRISSIVRAMKEFSHPGSEERQAIDLNRAIESTVTVARNEWKYVAEVELALDASLPCVPCHAAELNQVFLNLIVNAAQAIGGCRRTEKGKIRISTRRDGDFVLVTVADDGPGIRADVLPRIFDPFFTTKEVGKGTGQGLAIARSVVVDKHGGTIDVESVEGAGATFQIRLPLTAPEAG